jgi:CspA family cold shock protein
MLLRSSGCFDWFRRQRAAVEGVAMQGTVKWFSETKGFGFIVPSDGSDEVFVHYSDIEGEGRRDLTEGAQVE